MRHFLVVLFFLSYNTTSFCQLSKLPPKYRDDEFFIKHLDFNWPEDPIRFSNSVKLALPIYKDTEVESILKIRSYLINKTDLTNEEVEEIVSRLNTIDDCLVKILNLNVVSGYYENEDAVDKTYNFQRELNALHKACIESEPSNTVLLMNYANAKNNEAAFLVEYLTGGDLKVDSRELFLRAAKCSESADSVLTIVNQMTPVTINDRIEILSLKLSIYGDGLKDREKANLIIKEVETHFDELDDYSQRRFLFALLNHKNIFGYTEKDYKWIKLAKKLLENESYNVIYLPNAPIAFKYNIGNYYFQQKQYDSAKLYLLRSIKDTVNARSNKTLFYVQIDLSLTYSKMNLYDSAIYFLDQSRKTIDYIKSNRNPDEARKTLFGADIEELENKYASIANQIEQSNQASQRILIIAILCLGGLLLILIIYFRNAIKHFFTRLSQPTV